MYEQLKASVQQGDKGVKTFLPACRKKTEGHSVTVEELACNISADSEEKSILMYIVHQLLGTQGWDEKQCCSDVSLLTTVYFNHGSCICCLAKAIRGNTAISSNILCFDIDEVNLVASAEVSVFISNLHPLYYGLWIARCIAAQGHIPVQCSSFP